jgi:molybdenum cofactor cytidylyltransferase
MGLPKALLKLRKVTFLQALMDAAITCRLAPLVVVVGSDGDKLISNHDLHGAIVVRNETPELGPIASIAAGIAALINHPVDAVLVLQVDRPHVSIRTIDALINQFRLNRRAITVPTFEGRRGHPVLFASDVFAELQAAATNDQGARAVVRRDPTRVLTVPVADRAVLEDIDTPQDYARLIHALDQYSDDPKNASE